MFDIISVHPHLTLVIITVIPFLGLRVAIPLGIFLFGIHHVFKIASSLILIAILCSILGYYFIDWLIEIVSKTPGIGRIVRRWQTKVKKKTNHYVQKYGIFSLAGMLAVPLPGCGLYTASLVGSLLGYEIRDYFAGVVIGFLISGILLSLLSVILYVLII